MKKRIISLILALILVMGVCSIGYADSEKDVRVIPCGHPDPEGMTDFHYQYYILRLNEHLQEICDGAIQFEEVGAGKYGSEAEMFSGVSDGSIDSACISATTYDHQIPVMQLFSLPYMFQYMNQNEVLTTNEEFMAPIYEELKDDWGIICIAPPIQCGTRELISTKPVNSMADMKDMIVRNTNNPLFARDFEACGAIPTDIAYSEVYTALQQGVIDAVEMPIEAIYMQSYFELADSLTMLDMHGQFGWHMFSQECWDSLSEEEQGWITEAAQLAVADQWAKLEDHVNELIADMEENAGVIVLRPDLEEFKQATRVVHEEFRDTIGGGVLDQAYALLDADNAEKGLTLLSK